MSEDFEEQEAQPLDLGRYVDLVRRRHIQFLIPLFVGWLVVWGSSWFLQARYISSTLILVEEPTMPKNYVAPNVNDDLQARLQSISQQILSRTRLLLIIDNMKLYERQEGSRALSQTKSGTHAEGHRDRVGARSGQVDYRIPDQLHGTQSGDRPAGDEQADQPVY